MTVLRHHRPPSRVRRTLVSLLVALGVLGAALFVLSPSHAAAATMGVGYTQPGKPLNHLGGYLGPDGTLTYCIDAGIPSAVDRITTDGGMVPQVKGLDPQAMARLNLVLSSHGDTTDADTAAAVAMAVWSISDAQNYAAEGGDGFVLRRAPDSVRAHIKVLAEQFRAEAAAWVQPVGSVSLALSIDPADSTRGTVDVSTSPPSPGTVTGTVTLVNAVFMDSGSATRSAVTGGDHLSIIASPPAGSSDPYRVSAAATDFVTPGGPARAVHLYSTPGAQTLVASGGSTVVVFHANAGDSADRVVPVPPAPPLPPAQPLPPVPPLPVVPVVPSTPAVLAPALPPVVHLPIVSG